MLSFNPVQDSLLFLLLFPLLFLFLEDFQGRQNQFGYIIPIDLDLLLFEQFGSVQRGRNVTDIGFGNVLDTSFILLHGILCVVTFDSSQAFLQGRVEHFPQPVEEQIEQEEDCLVLNIEEFTF